MAALKNDSLQAELKSKSICRFCLDEDNSKLTDIYTRDTVKSSAPLVTQIMAITSIEVLSNDGMPRFVCSDCANIFEFSYQFKQMCKKADDLLRLFPLTGKLPKNLDKPILPKTSLIKPLSKVEECTTPYSELTVKKEKVKDYTITYLDKMENDGELSIDDIDQSLIAEEENEEKNDVPNFDTTIKTEILTEPYEKVLNNDEERENVNIKMEIEAEISGISESTSMETNIFPCLHCDRTFTLLQSLDLHLKTHGRERKFQCENCEKSFFTKDNLQRHINTHSASRPYKCSACDKSFPSAWLRVRHENSHSNLLKFVCTHCKRSFISKELMEKHMKRHNINRPFVCKICNKNFAFKHGLERHEIIHLNRQPYSCQYCDLSFSTPTKLSRHLKTHAGRRPYSCKFCKKTFLFPSQLKTHVRSHTSYDNLARNVIFACTTCNATFTSRNELIRHSTSHANVYNLTCSMCKEIFQNMDSLTVHIEKHYKSEAFACEFCDLTFITADKLQAHIDVDHIQEMDEYHADDRAQAGKHRELSNKQTHGTSSKQSKYTDNEFLHNEMDDEDNQSLESLNRRVKKDRALLCD